MGPRKWAASHDQADEQFLILSGSRSRSKVIGPHRLARLGPGRKRAMSAAIGQAMQVHLFLGYMDSKRIRWQNIEKCNT